MIRLTPLAETASGQELLKEERVQFLLLPIESKFTLSDIVRKGLPTSLVNLSIDVLQTLFPQMLHIDSLEQLEQWTADELPVQR